MNFYDLFVISFSFLPAPVVILLLCCLFFMGFILVLKIWQFIKDKIPFL